MDLEVLVGTNVYPFPVEEKVCGFENKCRICTKLESIEIQEGTKLIPFHVAEKKFVG